MTDNSNITLFCKHIPWKSLHDLFITNDVDLEILPELTDAMRGDRISLRLSSRAHRRAERDKIDNAK